MLNFILIEYSNIKCNQGYISAYNQNYATTLSSKSGLTIDYSRRLGSASIICVCKNSITINGTIDTSTPSFNNTLTTVDSTAYQQWQSGTSADFIHFYDSYFNGTM